MSTSSSSISVQIIDEFYRLLFIETIGFQYIVQKRKSWDIALGEALLSYIGS